MVNSLLGVVFTKPFDILPEIIRSRLPHFEFLGLYLDMFDQNFDQTF